MGSLLLPRCWVGVDATGAPSPSSPRGPWRGSVWCGRAETLASADEVDGFGRARPRAICAMDTAARQRRLRGRPRLARGSQRSFVPPPLMMLDKDLLVSSVVLIYSCPMTCELRCGILRSSEMVMADWHFGSAPIRSATRVPAVDVSKEAREKCE
jgi:hypothetical protein